MFIFCRVLCFHSPYLKTRVICLTRDKLARFPDPLAFGSGLGNLASDKRAYHNSNVPPCHEGRDGKKRGPGAGLLQTII